MHERTQEPLNRFSRNLILLPYRQKIREIYKQYIELGHVLGVTSVHLVDQPDLFKTDNLVYGGREIVLNV